MTAPRTLLCTILLTAISLPSAHGVLISHWALNGNALDSGPGSNDGTLGGDTTFATGQFGQAASFDGDNDYINFGDINAVDGASTLTIALWFKRTTDGSPATNHGVNNVLFAKSSATENDNLEIGTQGGNVELYVDSTSQDGPNPLGTAQSITDNTWTHLVMTYDSGNPSAELELFLNGVSVFTNGANGGSLDNAFSSPVSIGIARATSSNWGDFQGLMDEVYIYDHVLSDAQISHLHEFNRVPDTGSTLAFLGFVAAGCAFVRRKLR